MAPRDALVGLFFLLVAVAYYYPLTLQGRVLASFDTQVYFYPNATYLASRLRLGQVPLWDPFIFGGTPFLANSQVGALYPPQWLFVLGPVSSIYSWLIVGHVWLLAVGTYCFARNTVRLGRWGAAFAGVALAFGGFVGGMSGHLNQVESFAWLPFGILGLERTAFHRRWRYAFFAALPFALSALAGHSQVLFLTAILAVLAAWIRTAIHWRNDRLAGQLGFRRIAFDCLRLATGPIVGILLAAAQLVPTIELTRLSIRSHGLSFADAAAFSLPPNRLISILLPSIGQLPPSSEWYGWVGLSCLALAAFGAWRRPSRATLVFGLLAMFGVVVALGQYTPAYQVAFGLVPGVSLYRVPARWLAYWALALALLGGIGLNAALEDDSAWSWRRTKLFQLARPWFVPGVLVAVVAVGAVGYKYRSLIQWPSSATIGFWILSFGLTVVILRIARSYRSLAGPAFLSVLVAELFVTSLYLPLAEAVWPSAVESPGKTINALRSVSRGERVLALGDNSYDPGDLAAIRAQVSPTLPTGAMIQYVTSIKHVDGLTPNVSLQFGLPSLDGYDGGILPLDRYHDLKLLFPNQGRDVSDGRLRLQLLRPPPAALLGWLNIRFLVMDRLRDGWIDGIYYDLALQHTLASGEAVDLPIQPIFRTSAVGIVVENPNGRGPAGQITIALDSLASTLDIGNGLHPQSEFPDPTDAVPLAFWRDSVTQPIQTNTVRLAWAGTGPLTIRSLTLIGASPDPERSVPVDPDFRLSYLGDMKIYDNQLVRPRAFLADGLSVVPTLEAVVGRLTDQSWNAGETAVASGSDVSPALAFGPTTGSDSVRILADEPEYLVVATNAPQRKMLVVTDTAYPGWQVTLDGVAAPILPVDVTFRGVDLPAGSHTVVFRFDPISWRIGLVVTGIGIVTFAGGLFLTARRGSRIDASKLP